MSLRARQIVDEWVVAVRRSIPDELADLRRTGWVTNALLVQADDAYMKGAAGSFDLLTCSQDPLDHYDLGVPTVVGDRGKVRVTGNYGGPFVFTYEFLNTGGGWKLDRVVCPPP